MALHVRKNQYRGINAHLHSVLQIEGDWEGFHNAQIVDLMRVLDSQLPVGYVVNSEQSMQIRKYHPDTGEEILSESGRRPRIKPDVAIYQRSSSPKLDTQVVMMASPTLSLTLDEVAPFDPRLYLQAIAIHALEKDNSIGPVITLIELLSPANKPGGSGFAQYAEKRRAALRSGVVLVELDYLHATPSVTPSIPNYPNREPDSYPYTIIVSDPRPTWNFGSAQVYGFRVDDPIPTVNIPLALDDVPLSFDFGAVYHHTFESASVYSLWVNYDIEPLAFETYNDTNQQRIRARMQAVLQAHHLLTTQSGDPT